MTSYERSPYRWVILLCMIPILAVTNVFWLTFAPISSIAEAYYNVSSLRIALLSMIYMIVYIIAALPASYIVDTKGYRISMSIGAILTAFFGLLRGIYASNFTVITIAQFGVALGQPFLANAITKVAARWFPVDERATASGIATMAGYLGMIIGMVLTPILTTKYGIEKMLMIYAFVAIISAVIFILFSREYPKTLPCADSSYSNKLNRKDIKGIILKKDFRILITCMFVLMGIFNAIVTWIEDILKPRGITSVEAGLVGGVLVIVGLVGAVVLPIISDKVRKRVPLLVWPIVAAMLGFIGFTFSSNYSFIMFYSAIMGFFIMGMGPVAFQYGAEIAYPVPEGTSYGLLMLSGQISGIIFIYGMDFLRDSTSGQMTKPLIILLVLMCVAFLLATRLKESNIFEDI